MTEKITREEIEALLKLADAATPGPWKQHLVDDTTVICPQRDICCTFTEGGLNDDVDFSSDTEQCEADAAFIAAANPVVLKALCTLALQAEAMQPRPIEEYTGSAGPVIVYVPNDRWIDAWYSKANGWWTTDIYGLAEKKNEKNFVVEPTHFIPLTSLPEPSR